MQSKHECLKTEKGEEFTVGYRKDAKTHLQEGRSREWQERTRGGWGQGEARGGFKTAITSYF